MLLRLPRLSHLPGLHGSFTPSPPPTSVYPSCNTPRLLLLPTPHYSFLLTHFFSLFSASWLLLLPPTCHSYLHYLQSAILSIASSNMLFIYLFPPSRNSSSCCLYHPLRPDTKRCGSCLQEPYLERFTKEESESCVCRCGCRF